MAQRLLSHAPVRIDGCSAFGKIGEELACRELRRRGYEILDRRYRTRSGELDIIARQGGTIVFVEVKARRSDRYGSGAEAVTLRKQQRIAGMAADYLARHALERSACRFDVAVVSREENGSLSVQLISNAFEASKV